MPARYAVTASGVSSVRCSSGILTIAISLLLENVQQTFQFAEASISSGWVSPSGLTRQHQQTGKFAVQCSAFTPDHFQQELEYLHVTFRFVNVAAPSVKAMPPQ